MPRWFSRLGIKSPDSFFCLRANTSRLPTPIIPSSKKGNTNRQRRLDAARTLSMPKGDGPFPAVILVHGSVPLDRDETIGPNKPFRDLAHGLASRRMAVLRYETRTKHHQIMMAMTTSNITVKEETIDDVVSAFEALASQIRLILKESLSWATASAECSSPKSPQPRINQRFYQFSRLDQTFGGCGIGANPIYAVPRRKTQRRVAKKD